MNKQIIKNSFLTIMLISISVLIIWVGIKTLMDNYNRDIDQVDKLIGFIKNVEVISTAKKVGAVPSANLKLKFLSININGSEEKLFTYSASQNYTQLIRILKKGKLIVVYYKKIEEDEIMNNIYKIDLGGKNIIKHSDYKQKEYFAGIVMLLLGLFFLAYTGFILKKKGLKKNWG